MLGERASLGGAFSKPVRRKKSADPEANEAAEAFSRIHSLAVRVKVLALMRTLAKRP
jgi:hypothetical protein